MSDEEKSVEEVEQPTTEQPTTDQTATDQTATDQTATDQTAADQPTTDQPTTDQPTADQQTTDLQAAGTSDDQPAGDAVDPGIELDDPPTADAATSGEAALAPAPVSPYGVESWRPLVTEMAVDIPVEVLLRWIKHESAGDPCATGKIVDGASIENGLFQLYSPDDDHIATPAQLHGDFCSGQECTRDLTLNEARIQVASGIAYVRICRARARAQLKEGGVVWDESGSDFWSLVKMQHNLPSVPAFYVPRLHPASWSEFKEGVLREKPDYGKTTIFSNAEDIGAAAV
jgi:hypothetical protein